jgi:hypothetical protein
MQHLHRAEILLMHGTKIGRASQTYLTRLNAAA